MKLNLFWGEQPSHWPIGQWLGIFLHWCDCRAQSGSENQRMRGWNVREDRHDHHDGRTRTDGMKSSNTDKIEGALHEAKGKVKEVTGKIIGNPKLQNEGTAEKVSGKVQRKVGDINKVLGK